MTTDATGLLSFSLPGVGASMQRFGVCKKSKWSEVPIVRTHADHDRDTNRHVDSVALVPTIGTNLGNGPSNSRQAVECQRRDRIRTPVARYPLVGEFARWDARKRLAAFLARGRGDYMAVGVLAAPNRREM